MGRGDMLWDSLAQESIKERFRQQLHESDQKLRGEWAADRSAAVAAEVAKTTAVQEQYKQLEAAQAAQRESLGKQTEAAAILGEQLKADGAKHQAEKVRCRFIRDGGGLSDDKAGGEGSDDKAGGEGSDDKARAKVGALTKGCDGAGGSGAGGAGGAAGGGGGEGDGADRVRPRLRVTEGGSAHVAAGRGARGGHGAAGAWVGWFSDRIDATPTPTACLPQISRLTRCHCKQAHRD